MPNGTIQSYDPKAQEGHIEPKEDGGTLAFSLDDVADRKTGEMMQPGEEVTYEEADGRAVQVRRAAQTGYV